MAKKRLKDDDPSMSEDTTRFYIESVAIIPEYRGMKMGFLKMIRVFIKELERKGILKISMHARVSNNLSAIIQKILKVTPKRTIENWEYYNKEESTDYIEAEFSVNYRR
jgi:hypothetical protein